MAGMEPAALIVEIMNEDGTMARRPELERFAEKHGLPMGTIADLIAYRSLHEQSVELATRKTVSTDHGEFTLHVFRDLIDDTLHHALTCGDLSADAPTLVRVQPLDLLRDVFATRIEEREGWSVSKALARIRSEGRGALVLIGQERDRESELESVEAFQRAAATSDGSGAGVANYRIIGTGAQILQQLGIGRMRLMSAPLHFNALSGFNLEVTEFVQAG
jgi:3,4-dihydroxy 2-butanone 4-phosphate synthase/GTP cyclohydrolase II